MNILHLLFSFNNGGAENLVVDVINAWHTDDKIILCIINELYDQNLFNKIHNKNIEIVKLHRRPGEKKLVGMKTLRKVILERHIDIVHCHSVSAFEYILLSLGPFHRCKIVLTVHNLSVYRSLSRINILIQKLFINKIIAISKSVQESIVKAGVPNKKIDIIYNGIDPSKYHKSPGGNTTKRILCIGRMIPPIKGQDLLIRAMSHIIEHRKDIECVFIGGNPENHDYISDMKSLSKACGVEQYVSFLGNRHNVPEDLMMADVLVVPSREEGFGLVVLEGMMSKIPVISTNTGGPSELISDGKTGYLVPCNRPDKLADKIMTVLENSDKSIIDTAYKYAIINYSIHRTVRELYKCYMDLL